MIEDKVEPEVINWIKEKLESTLLMFDEAKHWNKELETIIKNIILLREEPKLFVWIEKDKLYFSKESEPNL